MELVSQKGNILIWQGLKPLLWFFLILTTLNLSTGAVIVLVSSGPNGGILDGDATTVPLGEVRLLHLELFGGIIHLHPETSSSAARPSFNYKVIENQKIVQSFDTLVSNFSTILTGPDPDFFPQTPFSLTGERPDPAGLKNGDKIITSSSTEPGLSRVFSPNFQDPYKTVSLLQFDVISQWLVAVQPDWSGIFPFPPEKPPKF